jgi:hypothetical protein
MKDYPVERLYKSAWHIGLVMLGLYELRRTHHTRLGKVLAVGMLLFHADAAVADALDKPCLTRRILECLRP